ncbi:hypothetical protein Tco_0722994 [Tanacetum coccineum]
MTPTASHPKACCPDLSHRMAILECRWQRLIHGALAEQREVINVMARDFSRFTRRVRQRTGEASTSAAQIKPGRPRERNIDEYWWRIYKSGDLKVLES